MQCSTQSCIWYVGPSRPLPPDPPPEHDCCPFVTAPLPLPNWWHDPLVLARMFTHVRITWFNGCWVCISFHFRRQRLGLAYGLRRRGSLRRWTPRGWEALKKAVTEGKASGSLWALFLALILDEPPNYASSILWNHHFFIEELQTQARFNSFRFDAVCEFFHVRGCTH